MSKLFTLLSKMIPKEDRYCEKNNISKKRISRVENTQIPNESKYYIDGELLLTATIELKPNVILKFNETQNC